MRTWGISKENSLTETFFQGVKFLMATALAQLEEPREMLLHTRFPGPTAGRDLAVCF